MERMERVEQEEQGVSGTEGQETPYIEAETEKLLGKGYEGPRTVRIPQKSTEGVEELAKEHGVFIPKLNSIIHQSDIDPDMIPTASSKNYEAFEDAEVIPWISDLLKMKPSQQVLGIKLTEAIDLPDFPTGEYRWVRSAVSSLGCLYIMDNWGKVLHCVNLMTGKRSRIGPFEAESFVACYQSLVIIGTNGKEVLYTIDTDDIYEPIEDIEEGAEHNEPSLHIEEHEVPMEKLSTLPCPLINQNYGFHACTEFCPSTGILTFFDDSLSFIEYNIPKREYNVYKNDKQLTRIISTTAISMTEYKMFATSSFLKRKMYGVDTVWGEKFIASLKWPIMLMIPSMHEPDNISKAAFIDSNGYLYYNSKTTPLTSPFRPIDYQGMIRIHKDVFIILDANSLVWRAMRIIVP